MMQHNNQNMVEYPRVLLITHNAFNFNKNNGKTFNALFRGWSTNAIAQLYFLNEVPESDYCKKYFRITDLDIFKALIKLKRPKSCGQAIRTNEGNRIETNVVPENYFVRLAIQFNKKIFGKILRDVLWSSNVWKTQSLKDWLKDVNPEVVFLGVGNAAFSANIAYWISNHLGIPLCLYYGDDYVLNANYGSLLNKIQHKRVKSFHDRNLKHAKKLIAIGDLMASAYQKAYGKEVVIVRTGVDIVDHSIKKDNTDSQKLLLSYVGGLHLNRFKSIIELGDLLRELQVNIPAKIVLNIYSLTDITSSLFASLNKSPLNFCGKVYGNDVSNIMQNSDILVHVESLDIKYRKLTSFSISTKIPEYLAAGKCIVCYGPDEVASIKLISDNNIGVVLTEQDSHETKKNKLLKILINETERVMLGRRAKKYAQEKFSRTINNETLRLALLDCVQSNKVN